MKKTLIGLLAGIVNLALGMLIGRIFFILIPSLNAEFGNTYLFRPFWDPLMGLYFVHPFLVGVIMAWIWSAARVIWKGKTTISHGIYFGLSYWIMTSVPGMLISYSSFPLSFAMICNWSATALVQCLCSGILFSFLLKKEESPENVQ